MFIYDVLCSGALGVYLLLDCSSKFYAPEFWDLNYFLSAFLTLCCFRVLLQSSVHLKYCSNAVTLECGFRVSVSFTTVARVSPKSLVGEVVHIFFHQWGSQLLLCGSKLCRLALLVVDSAGAGWLKSCRPYVRSRLQRLHDGYRTECSWFEQSTICLLCECEPLSIHIPQLLPTDSLPVQCTGKGQ